MNVLVVPTIRKDCIDEFLDAWKSMDWKIIVIEDNPKLTFGINDVECYSWQEIDEELGDKSWIISRHDCAIKCFGFWKAYKMGADYIFALDDDVFPIDSNHIEKHIDNLEKTTRWTESVLGYRTRGIPYINKGYLSNVVLSVGLWEGTPDFDAISVLNGNTDIILPEHNRLIPKGQYFPQCGMNLCFRREITPMMYFPLMGDGQPYHRFDDIWCGIITKKIMDHLDLHVSVGKPFVYHTKASNVFANFSKESPGIVANEQFWETIDNIQLTENSVIGCMHEIGKSLQDSNDHYLIKLGDAIITWASLFSVH